MFTFPVIKSSGINIALMCLSFKYLKHLSNGNFLLHLHISNTNTLVNLKVICCNIFCYKSCCKFCILCS